MIWATTIATFLATTLILMALVYAFSTSAGTTGERLTNLWNPVAARPKRQLGAKQKEQAKRILTDIAKLVPASTKTQSRTRRMMVRAGIRSAEATTAMRGAKILLPATLVTLAYVTKFYKFNPFLIFAACLMVGIMLPDLFISWRIRRRQHKITLALPDALDLMVVSVEAGLGLDQGIMRVAQELQVAHPELSDELQLVNLEMRVGKTRIEALRELAQRTGVDDIKALVAMLIQTDRFGTSLAQSLRVHSDTLRTRRRQRAEEMAAKTTVKMVPVLVFFIFPALFIVILGPGVIAVIRNLLPTFNGER